MMELFCRIKRDGDVLGISPLFAHAKRIIVGFSGGADSSLLLSYFVHLRDTVENFPEVRAVHVNHMIRGTEADSDETFCRCRCAELSVPLEVRRIDVPALAVESGLGLEECARNVRYELFGSLAEDGVLVATAHNADDNLETVLFNLARGSGTGGLSGIPPVRDGYIVRPLLCLTGDEIREGCRELGIPFAVDSTNVDEAYTRNFIRHSVVPKLKQVNSSAAMASVRAGMALRSDDEFIRGLARDAVGQYLQGGSAEVPRDVMAALPDAVMSRAVVMLVGCVTEIAMSHEQVRECRRLIVGGGTGKVSLPDGVTFEVAKNLVRAGRVREAEPFCFDVELPDGEECVKYSCAEGGFDLYFCRSECGLPETEENIYKLSINTAVRFDTIYGRVFARSRMPGDTLYLGGHTRRLKKMICDRGIPESERDRLPVICDDDGVLLVPGLPVRGPAYARAEDFSAGNVIYMLYCLYRKF